MIKKLGCIKDKFNGKDYLMRAYLPVVKLPKKIDYTKKLSPVRDQGNEGTCVSFACASGMKEYQEMLDYEKLVELSPRFIYSECKKIDGMPESEGTTLRAAMQVLSKKGVCQEKFWPYKPYQKDKAKKGFSTNAKKFRIKTYARILNLNELRLNIATKGPCIIGVQVYEGMMKTKTGLVPMPKKNESALGGHAICPVGYDDTKKLIKFKNSWSDKWGQKGYGFLNYAYIEQYMIDAWSSVDIEDPNPLTLASVLQFAEKRIS
ncbi:MAG: C1 family peptidase [Candidatus Omnitrophica bacterium]|nr:C1 family peptidase [Candidatus Omnitrophota bacterium]